MGASLSQISRFVPALAASVAVILGLCWAARGFAQGAAPDLWGTQWRLDELEGINLHGPPWATLSFVNGRIAGTSFCNRYSARATIAQDLRVSIGALTISQRACASGLSRNETAFLVAFAAVERLEISGSHLLIHTRKSKTPMRFTPLKGQ